MGGDRPGSRAGSSPGAPRGVSSVLPGDAALPWHLGMPSALRRLSARPGADGLPAFAALGAQGLANRAEYRAALRYHGLGQDGAACAAGLAAAPVDHEP